MNRYTILSFLFVILSWNVSADPLHSTSRETFHERSLSYILLPRKKIPLSILGLNAFANERMFGSVKTQLRETKDILGVRYLRVLFAWNDQVQPTPESAIDFSFYDDIARSIPRGSEALVVLTGIPSWMKDSKNWIDGNPRKTFSELWVKKVSARYRHRKSIRSYQIWNEPNMVENPDNTVMDLAEKPENYKEMLEYSYRVSKRNARSKRIVSASVTAINQNFPDTPEYMKRMIESNIEKFCDIVGIHYYGTSLENVYRSGGAQDVLKSLRRPIWITESGIRGSNKQNEYVSRVFPFLKKEFPRIGRIYYYQFTEGTPSGESYGLRNNEGYSDLYNSLKKMRQAR